MAERNSIKQKDIVKEMRSSYLDYAMSVIVGRALPEVRDGLKPVHRRILYAMHEAGMLHNKPFKKSARIVGDVLGKYHPHGDVAVYDAIARMVQDFSLRYPLINGQGNFGSIDGDSPAAMRYTEVRMERIAEEILADIEKETVALAPNYDGSLKEPTVLPAKLPNLLVNGSSGIAVGMATNMPPHNLAEVVDAVVMQIDNPKVGMEELMTAIKGPDFPTGAIIHGIAGIRSAYLKGRGLIKIRAKAEIKERKGKGSRILVTEVPYQVNKSKLIEGIASLVREKKIEGIRDLRDESDREGIRIVMDLSTNANPEIVLNQLYKHTQMGSTFGVINLALVNGEPKVMDLKELITHFIAHRKDVVTRRTKFELKNAEKRAHILEGLRTALKNLNKVIKTIRGAKDVKVAQKALVKDFDLSREQAKAILEMRLQRLTALEREKIDKELKELLSRIEWLREVLAKEERKLEIIKEELLELKDRYGDERRTEIVEVGTEIEDEDLIPVEDMVIIITNTGYIKRISVDAYRMQKRGGKGVIGMETKEEDFVENLFIASTHDHVLFFTNKGRVYWKKVYMIVPGGRYSKGKALVNFLQLDSDERVTATIRVESFDEGHSLLFATKKGKVKKTTLSAYSRPRVTGIKAISLGDEDEVIGVKLTDGEQEILLATRKGKAIRFSEKDVRRMGRTAAGVRGIRLGKGDEVIAMEVPFAEASLLTITENGYGKRTRIEEYRLQGRGGKGVINIITSERNGVAVDIKEVTDGDELIVTSLEGIVIRLPASDISVIGRSTQGVRIMKLNEGDKVVAVAKIAPEED